MKIINLTQHNATPDQLESGVVDLPEDSRKVLRDLLTFEEIPGEEEIFARSRAIARLAKELAPILGADSAMIGGAMWLMAPLQEALRVAGIRPLFAFSRRRSVERPTPDGGVEKIQVFFHAGFVPAVDCNCRYVGVCGA